MVIHVICLIKRNSVLQILNNIKIFKEQIQKLKYSSKKSKTTFFLSIIFENLKKKDEEKIFENIKKIKKILFNGFFNNKKQQDCYEFLKFLLNRIHFENEKIFKLKIKDFFFNEKKSIFSNFEKFYFFCEKKSDSFINKLFNGILLVKIKCLNCYNKIYKFENFQEITLDLYNKNLSNFENNEKIDIYKIIENFFLKEKIKNYKCEKCEKITSIEKSCKIIKFPQIFIFVLKRFSFFPKKKKLKNKINISKNRQNFENFYCKFEKFKKNNKISNKFFFNEKKKGNYKLKNFINHFGDLDFGHYSSICYDKQINRWIHFNDQKVSFFKKNILQKSSKYCYILFYERKT